MRRFYYFGCRGTQCGHYLFGNQYNKDRDRLDNGFPVHLLDGMFAPVDSNDRSWRLVHLRFQGIVSILACHDNTIDKRGGSNAAFVAIDDRPWTAAEILEEAKRDFPDCAERLSGVKVAGDSEPRQGAAESAVLFSDVEADIEGIDIGIDLADAASKGAR